MNITNRTVPCTYCRHQAVRPTTRQYSQGKQLFLEQRWVCPRCQQVVRSQVEEVKQDG